MKQKTMHQSSFRPAIKAIAIVGFSTFFLANVFSKPALMGSLQEKQSPISMFAKLSIQSQSLINDLQGMVNRSGLLPAGTAITAPFVLETISENRGGLSLNIGATVSTLEKRVEALKEICEKTRDGWLKAKLANLQIQLAVLKTFSEQATPNEQKQLLSELSKTFVVPVAP